MLCEHCANAGFHGFRRDGYPSTVYFWCEPERTHNSRRRQCVSFAEGEPKKYDKRGNMIGGETQ